MTYSRDRASFIEYCGKEHPCFKIWGSLLTISGETFADNSMEFTYSCWLDAWTAGFATAVDGIKDNRIGIADKINPDLLNRKLRDWA
jgi:hypothetical protein